MRRNESRVDDGLNNFLSAPDRSLHISASRRKSSRVSAMAERRSNGDNPSKRQKMSGLDPSSNPYLAHQYPDDAADEGSYENGNSYNGGSRFKATSNGQGQTGGLKHFKRHQTTTQQAKIAEDGPSNPFNGNSLSERYFGILKTRRGLPVHAQRSVICCSVYLTGS